MSETSRVLLVSIHPLEQDQTYRSRYQRFVNFSLLLLLFGRRRLLFFLLLLLLLFDFDWYQSARSRLREGEAATNQHI